MSRHGLLVLVLLAAFAAGTAGCDKNKTAAQLAAERQGLIKAEKKQKARQYYTELIEKYPESEHSAKAKERLRALGPMTATPKPVKK